MLFTNLAFFGGRVRGHLWGAHDQWCAPTEMHNRAARKTRDSLFIAFKCDGRLIGHHASLLPAVLRLLLQCCNALDSPPAGRQLLAAAYVP
jgi:hypothetical protein